MSLYPASPSLATRVSGAADDLLPLAAGSMMIAVRAGDLVSPAGRPAGAGDRSALAVAGTARIRSGELVAFCKVVVVAPAVVRRDGWIQADGKPCDYARLGVLEERLDEIGRASCRERV